MFELNTEVRVLLIFAAFFVVLLLAYYGMAFFNRLSNNHRKSKNMQLVEGLYVGPQKSLQLVRVGETYFLISVTKNDVRFLKEVDPSEITLHASIKPEYPFAHYLNRIKKEKKVDKGDNHDK